MKPSINRTTVQPYNRTAVQPYSRTSSEIQFRKHFFSSLMLMALFWLTSCAKQDVIQSPSTEDPSIPRIKTSSLSSVADRLYFSDFSDFIEYYSELDSLFTEDLEVFDSIVIADSPVQTINELYSSNLSYSTFLADPIMRAILNPYYEFQIDSTIITFINNDVILAFDANDGTARSAIRGITKGVRLDIEEIPSGAYWAKPDDIENAIHIGCGCNVYVRAYPDCENVRIWGRCNGFWGNDGDGDVTAEFDPNGPGAPVQVVDEEISGNFEIFINVSFLPLYQQEGIFNVTVDPECQLAQNRYASFYFDPSDFAGCDESHRTASDILTNGTERMKIETSFYVNNLHYACHKSEIRSETYNGTKWESTKASLWCSVEANQISIGCDYYDSKDDDATCNNCKGKATIVRWATDDITHCDGDLVGSYRKNKSSITLQDTQSVDFDCCGQ